jgi:hypothetical protein
MEKMEHAFLKGVGYCKHCHYHYPYIGGTNINFSRRNLNKV